MKKIGKIKGRKHVLTATCLLIGMMVLTTAVYANYDDAKGYSNFKEAVKNLALTEDNYTLDGSAKILSDEKIISDVSMKMKLEGKNLSGITNLSESGEKTVSEQYSQDGATYSYTPKTNTFYKSVQAQDQVQYNGILGIDAKDPTTKKAIRFTELFADTMIGELKNNFVLVSSEGDLKEYAVDISGNQIPEIVNAGLSFMFTAYNTDQSNNNSIGVGGVSYEDYNATWNAFYEETQGKVFVEGDNSASATDVVIQVDSELGKKYEDVLKSKNDTGYVYVKADGSYDYYSNEEQFREAVPFVGIDMDEIIKSMGNDPYIDKAICNFTIDKKGRIVATSMEATMSGVGKDGKKHSLTMKGNMDISDYGKTVVDTFDPSGKIEARW